MLIPATKELEQQSGVPARGVLLPIAHPTTLAGSALIGTSSNLLIAGLAAPAGVDIKMFSFVPIAVPVALIGWLVLVIAAPLMLRGRPERSARKLDWRAEIPVAAGANAVGRSAAELGVSTTSEFELVEIQRWGDVIGPDGIVAAGDVLIYRATESGVRMLWGSIRFGHANQELYIVSIADDESASIRDLEEEEAVQVIAAQSTKRLRDTAALPGEMCLVTTSSVTALADHSLVGLWQQVAGKAPQTAKTWTAVAVLAMSTGSTVLVMLVIAIVTTVLTNVVTNAAAAAILTPVALTVAASTGLDPLLLLTLIGTCISFTFLNPFSHQSNLMVMKPGGYSIATFLRFGIPLTVVSVAAAFGVAWANSL
ncbi:SLC13 family permease [Mycolicibacterium sarraceniae]|uniref:Citrate transporter-like domain-containing protein n=1 Tax=Mycolicibacterium sarraceniae TaxID=1534348 RepID=A0A7I7SWV1_9MYCO|nr:hypothetical protein MSAR_38250 [Mycolicibacterium sarraceniae]